MNIIDRLNKENKNQIEELIEIADNWRTSDSSTYKTEIGRRIDYLNGDMESDMKTELKASFPKSYDNLKNRMVTYPVYQLITERKCRAFNRKGARFVLNESSGEEVDAKNKVATSFNAMIESAQLEHALEEMERVYDACYSCACKAWWNGKHVEVSVFDPLKCHIAVNPYYEYDPYAAYAVLFEREPLDGPGDADNPRYEVWGMRADEVANAIDDNGESIYHPTVHYMATKEDQITINDEDKNPFIDRRYGNHMYPFTWFTRKRNTIYYKGGDQLVQLARNINLGMTWLHYNIGWQITAAPQFNVQAGQVSKDALDKLRNEMTFTPDMAQSLPPGVTMEWVTPDKDPAPFTSFYEMLSQYAAMFNNLSPRSVDARNGLPASGIALRIEMDNVITASDKRVKQLKPQVVDLLNRMIVVWNYYRREHGYAEIPKGFNPHWIPGDIDSGPIDYIEIGNKYREQIAANVATPIDWIMEVREVDKPTAEKIFKENQKINSDNLMSQTRYPDAPDAAEKAIDDIPVEDEPTETKAADTPDDDELKRIEKINVYQLAKAIEAGAATPVDLRMQLFGEDRATAEKRVMEATGFNLELAKQLGEIAVAEKAPMLEAEGKVPATTKPEVDEGEEE